jgi:hypothetical protein
MAGDLIERNHGFRAKSLLFVIASREAAWRSLLCAPERRDGHGPWGLAMTSDGIVS